MNTEISAEFVDNVVRTAAFLDGIFDKFYKQYKVTRVQFLALFYIIEEEPEGITLSHLGEKMGVSRANITTLADRMESAALIKRMPDPSDRRTIKVVALPKGNRLLDEILPRRQEFIDSILCELTEEELIQSNKMLVKIYTSLQERLKDQ